MIRSLIILIFLTVIVSTARAQFYSDSVTEYNHYQTEVPEQQPARINLSGPRLGLTLLTGSLADRLGDDFGVGPLVSQFGWQFERQFIATTNGIQPLTEFVVLVGGAEQGVFLPSLSWLVGFRNKKGTEFGVGPNLSLAGVSLVIAFGVTHSTETINFPINFAIAPSANGARFSILIGFNSGD